MEFKFCLKILCKSHFRIMIFLSLVFLQTFPQFISQFVVTGAHDVCAECWCRDPEGILACCTHIPPLVQQNLIELHAVIRVARERPLEKVWFTVYFDSTLNTLLTVMMTMMSVAYILVYKSTSFWQIFAQKSGVDLYGITNFLLVDDP